MTNYEEYVFGTDLIKADTDGDGITDRWEVVYSKYNGAIAECEGIDFCLCTLPVCSNPLVNDSTLDLDNDTLINLQEFELGFDPINPTIPPRVGLTLNPTSGLQPLSVDIIAALTQAKNTAAHIEKYILIYNYEEALPFELNATTIAALEAQIATDSSFGMVRLLTAEDAVL